MTQVRAGAVRPVVRRRRARWWAAKTGRRRPRCGARMAPRRVAREPSRRFAARGAARRPASAASTAPAARAGGCAPCRRRSAPRSPHVIRRNVRRAHTGAAGPRGGARAGRRPATARAATSRPARRAHPDRARRRRRSAHRAEPRRRRRADRGRRSPAGRLAAPHGPFAEPGAVGDGGVRRGRRSDPSQLVLGATDRRHLLPGRRRDADRPTGSDRVHQ